MDLSNRQGRREQGQRIQAAVERAGLSIEELAGRIGCSRALIYQYLSGTTLAQPDRLQQIAAECGVALAYFYSDSEPAPSTGTEPPPVLTLSGQDLTTRLTDSLRTLQELAEAQSGPPDYRALLSTCERILSIAAQLSDRAVLVRTQVRFGSALLYLAEYPRAADALTRAVALAVETGATEAEITARQSLGNALLQMGRTEEARDQFARIARGPTFTGQWQGTLSLGSIHELRGEYQQAMQMFDAAAVILEEGESTGTARPGETAIGQLYVNTNRRNVYMDGGDFRGALPLAERGLSDAESLGSADQHLEARFDLAWCHFHLGEWASAHRGFTKTLQLARFVGDQGRENMTRAWLGIFQAAAGDFDEAISCGKDALAKSLSRGDRRSELYAQLALADAYTGQTGRDSEARYHTSQALAVATALRHDRHEAECRLRVARLALQTGEFDEGREAAARAAAMANRLGARHLESLARCRLAETRLYATDGVLPPGVQDEAETALKLAEETGCVEGQWRAHAVLAAAALRAGQDTAPAERHLRQAIETLEALRATLNEAGIPDTLLENEDCLRVYARLAALLIEADSKQAAREFLEQTGWPPLMRQVEAMESAEER